MITFSISDATISYLLYLLLFFSAISIIILCYLVSITKSNTEAIMKITTKIACDLAANYITSTNVSGEKILADLSMYRKGFGGMASPPNVNCHCGKIKELNKPCDCPLKDTASKIPISVSEAEKHIKNLHEQSVKGFSKGGLVSCDDLANV